MVTIAAAICAFAIHAAHLAPWCPSIWDEAIAVVDEGRRLGRHASSFGTTSFFYDALNRLVSRTADGEKEEFSYDATGLLLSASNSVAFEAFSYDQCGRLSASSTLIGQNTYDVTYLRDSGGLATNISYGAGMSVSREYDVDGRLVAVRDSLGHEWTFQWDGEGKPLGGTSPDGRAHSLSYDAAGRLAGWSVGSVAGRAIERDAAGRRVRDMVTVGTVPVPQAERRAQNVFDRAGRIVSATVEFGTNAPVAEAYFHDAGGAMTNATSGGEAVFSAAYNAFGQLVSLDAPAGTTGVSPVASDFAYDALGNRVRAGGRIWIPDHDDPLKRPLLECDEGGTPVRAYIWGAGRLLGFVDIGRAGSPLPADVLTVVHCDEQGSVIALSSSSGTILHTAHYGPHGEDWGSTGENSTPFAWLGGLGVMRMGTGTTGVSPVASSAFSMLYLTRHRLYAPSLRRFLSSDPVGLSGGLNLYAYGSGDPLAYIDPLGLSPFNAAVKGFFEGLKEGLQAEARIADMIWNFGLQFMVSNPNFRDAGVQNAVYQVIVNDFGSPLMRLGAYGDGEKPTVVDGDIVNAVWDLGAAFTACRNLGVNGAVRPVVKSKMDLLPDVGTTTLYHGGRLIDGRVIGGRNFSTTPDYFYATKNAEMRGGDVFRFDVPNRFINENAVRRFDNISGTPFTGIEYRFNGVNVNELNIFMVR